MISAVGLVLAATVCSQVSLKVRVSDGTPRPDGKEVTIYDPSTNRPMADTSTTDAHGIATINLRSNRGTIRVSVRAGDPPFSAPAVDYELPQPHDLINWMHPQQEAQVTRRGVWVWDPCCRRWVCCCRDYARLQVIPSATVARNEQSQPLHARSSVGRTLGEASDKFDCLRSLPSPAQSLEGIVASRIGGRANATPSQERLRPGVDFPVPEYKPQVSYDAISLSFRYQQPVGGQATDTLVAGQGL